MKLRNLPLGARLRLPQPRCLSLRCARRARRPSLGWPGSAWRGSLRGERRPLVPKPAGGKGVEWGKWQGGGVGWWWCEGCGWRWLVGGDWVRGGSFFTCCATITYCVRIGSTIRAAPSAPQLCNQKAVTDGIGHPMALIGNPMRSRRPSLASGAASAATASPA